MSTELELLLRFVYSFSSGLRSFLKYAKYLSITHFASAKKLLRHEYLQCVGAQLNCRFLRHRSTLPINDVNAYKSKIVAYYSDMSDMEGLLNKHLRSRICPRVIDELMPSTNLFSHYFREAMQEGNHRSERFVSIVAPSTASSS